jgi:RNA-binding protein
LTKQDPTIQVGKNGITDQLLKEIEKQLDKNKMVKIKILRTALGEEDVKQLACKIAARTEATLVEVRGHTLMLYKPRNK